MPQSAQNGAQRDLTRERDQEVIPAAKELLQALAARADLAMGSAASLTAEQAAGYYQKVYQEDVVPLLIKHNLKLNAIPYLFSIILQPMQLLNDVVTSSFEMNRNIADAFKYDIADIDDLRVLDLDAALKTGAAALKKRAGEKTEALQTPPKAAKKAKKDKKSK